jgi:mannitol/fructose-specific phosphotransferase system IIA component (Ntr-type)
MKQLINAFEKGRVVLDVSASDMQSAIRMTVHQLVASSIITEEAAEQVIDGLLKRETLAPTAIGNAVAIPHAYLEVIPEQLVVFVRLSHALNLGAPDGIPTHFLFFLLGPPQSAANHIDTLAGVARLMSDDEFRYEAGAANSNQDLLAALEHFTERTSTQVMDLEERVDDGLVRTGRLCGGLLNDIARRLPHYVSDFTDGFHTKSVAATMFLFFACLAPAVTFGGIMAELTGNHIGAVEMIIGSAICGIVYVLFSGQPMIILGGTGPLLIFTWLLYVLCGQLGLERHFLESRAWVGLWTGLLLILMAVTDLSALVRFFTRFIDEIFAALISIIFIYAAIEKLAHTVTEVYANERFSHDRALVPLILAMGTFMGALMLSRLRRSRYLRHGVREFLSDFGPAIAMVVLTLVALTWFHDVHTPTLPAPDSIAPTIERSWFVNPLDAPRWVWFAALGPAILAAVLVYLDQNITARLVNSPDNKLLKGPAYHLDLAVMGVLIAACSLFGLPWLVAATVRSLNHVRSLATVENVVTGKGESKERVLHVRETRLTGLAIHVLIGLSIFALPLLKTIPMAVLYGLFLFMGVVSMSGNQFFERMQLFLMDPSLYPTTHYIRRVPLMTIHNFTLIQLACLIALGAVELSPLGILFPIFILLLVPVRYMLGRFFAAEHLEALDSEEDPDDLD